jgi:hypothetical protein
MKRKSSCGYRFAWVLSLLGLVLTFSAPVQADLTFAGPSGFIHSPSGTTIKEKGIELGFHTRLFQVPKTSNKRFLTNLTMGFSPVKDFEIGVAKAMDSRTGANDPDPDPTVNLKVRLPPIGTGELTETAVGLILDTNPNNYHSLYLSVGGLGVSWNFGGNPGSGIAHLGSYDSGKKEPRSVSFFVGADLTPLKPGERGYRSHYLVDYNGDVFALAWRYKSHRGFWVDAGVQSQTTYRDWYDYLPGFIGFGAIF